MAKGQKKSNREAKKPKADKKLPVASTTSPFSQPPSSKQAPKRPPG